MRKIYKFSNLLQLHQHLKKTLFFQKKYNQYKKRSKKLLSLIYPPRFLSCINIIPKKKKTIAFSKQIETKTHPQKKKNPQSTQARNLSWQKKKDLRTTR